MVYYRINIPTDVGFSITSITQLWKPWSYPLTATSRVTPKLSSKRITLHEISNTNTQGGPNELKKHEQNSYITIRLKHKNYFMNLNLVCKRLKRLNIWKAGIIQIISNLVNQQLCGVYFDLRN
jgi:hypothetical protein